MSKYGKASYGEGKVKVPNLIKQFDEKLNAKGLEWFAPEVGLDKRDPFRVRLVSSIVSTTTLMHGGNLFIPVAKKLQDRKADIRRLFQ